MAKSVGHALTDSAIFLRDEEGVILIFIHFHFYISLIHVNETCILKEKENSSLLALSRYMKTTWNQLLVILESLPFVKPFRVKGRCGLAYSRFKRPSNWQISYSAVGLVREVKSYLLSFHRRKMDGLLSSSLIHLWSKYLLILWFELQSLAIQW